jgi:hypothetical protein
MLSPGRGRPQYLACAAARASKEKCREVAWRLWLRTT